VDLSLAELAKLVHYDKSYLSKIENGFKAASIDVARRCDAALGADGALAALVPHTATIGAWPADGWSNGDDVWTLSLARDGMNQFTSANSRAAVTSGTGFGIPYRDIAAAGEETLSVFQSLFHECVRMSDVVGANAAIPTVIAQVHILRNLAATASSAVRPALLVLAGRYAEYAGWTAQEAGDDRAALWWTNLSATIAAQAASVDLAAFTCARRAEIALYREDTVQSIALARKAQENPGVQPRIRGFAALREAQAHALSGDYDECGRALDRATAMLGTDGPAMLGGLPVPPLGPRIPGSVTGWCMHDLGRVREATTILDQEINFIPKSYRHAAGRYRVRRVLAHAASGEVDHACTLAHDLLDSPEPVRSAVIRRDVRDLARTLARWHTHRPVRELYPRLTAAMRSPAAPENS